MDNLCGCIRCINDRVTQMEKQDNTWLTPGPLVPGWRYACEICGNKRCPHHTNHTLACTNSNEPGQPGSIYV